MQTARKSRTATSCVAALSIAALALSGCGGGSAGAGSSGAASTAASTTAAVKLTQTNFRQASTNPDAFKQSPVNVVAQVFNEGTANDGTPYVQAWFDPDNSDLAGIVFGPGVADLKDQEYIRVIGTLLGGTHVTTLLGKKENLPTINASSITVVDKTATLPRASAVGLVQPRTVVQHGVAIHVSKVEYTDTQTRVFLTVTNRASGHATFFAFEARAVSAGGQQTKADSSQYGFPEVDSDILPGAASSGIVFFGPLSQLTPTRFYFQAHTSNYMLTFRDYIFRSMPKARATR